MHVKVSKIANFRQTQNPKAFCFSLSEHHLLFVGLVGVIFGENDF
jgi:hypothetical protein